MRTAAPMIPPRMAPTFGEDPLVLAATAFAVAVAVDESVGLAGVGTNGTEEVTGAAGLAVGKVTRGALEVERAGPRDVITRRVVVVGRTAPPVVEGSSVMGSVGSIGSLGMTKSMRRMSMMLIPIQVH